jgi:hypothetical protein
LYWNLAHSLQLLIGLVRSTGGAIAIAIYSTIIRGKATSAIAPRVAAAAVEAGLGQYCTKLTSFGHSLHCGIFRSRRG